MLLTLISTYMQNIIWILLVHNLFLAANVYKYTVRYAVRLPINDLPDYIQNSSVKLFADDSIIYHPRAQAAGPRHHRPARLECPPNLRGSGRPTMVGVRLAHALPSTKMPNHAHHAGKWQMEFNS